MISGFSNCPKTKQQSDSKSFEWLGVPEATLSRHFCIRHGLGYIKITNPTNKKF